jgi:2-C-methyl-D-erythritol 2,4-cyclodiphosphate synthase
MTRTGIGYDSHRLAPPGPLTLGGIQIPFERRLHGHSDGDAVCHALTDAILGAAVAGDIGEMFSDRDPANKGRDSVDMLRLAVERFGRDGFRVLHADVTVIAEAPRLADYRNTMRARLAEAMGMDPANVSVKAKSNEGMGWIGRGEGIACIAAVTLGLQGV